jgi:hypothetical protein
MKTLLPALALLFASCTTPHWGAGPLAPGRGWMDLIPPMQLRVENAYYRTSYVGTEIAHYQVQQNGSLRLLSTQPLKDRPRDQPPVEQLMQSSVRRYRYHRFYFEVLFKRNSSARGSVVLGARSIAELDRLTEQLLVDPDSVCNDRSTHCTVFPKSCSVSVDAKPIPPA